MIHQKKPHKFSIGMMGLAMLLLILIIGLIVWLKPKNNPENPPQTSASFIQPPTENAPKLSNTVEPQAPNLSSMPPSLQGTQVDGEIIIDEDKNLVVTAGLRQLFDYFLTAQGEEPLTTIYQRIQQYIKQRTPEPANSQVMRLYQNYIEYLHAMSLIEKKYQINWANGQNIQMDLPKIAARQQEIQQLRQQHFDSNTIQAFFGDEDALLSYNLTLLQIQQNPNLSSHEQQQMAEQAKEVYLSSITDPNLKNQLSYQANIEKLLQKTEQMKLQGASIEEINAMRRQYVNEDAVQRLAQLDEQEMAFDQRFKLYQQQRDTILQNHSDHQQAQQDIQMLQQQMFNETEIKRLTGYEALHNQ